MEQLIKALMSAPDWMRVREVTVESEGSSTVLRREDLEGYQFPMGAFRLTVDVAPTRVN